MFVLTKKNKTRLNWSENLEFKIGKLGIWEFGKPCGELLKRYDSEGDGCRLDWIKKLLLDISKRLCARTDKNCVDEFC